MKSFESSQGENKTYPIHVEGGGGDLKRFPGREHQNVFKSLGEGKLNRGREFENVFKFPWVGVGVGFENVFKFPCVCVGGGGNLKTFSSSRGNMNQGRDLKTLHRGKEYSGV